MTQPTLIKISGHDLDDSAYLTRFATIIRNLNTPTIVVHGGGAEITALQTQMGIEARYADGLRITDAASLQVVEMVLCGTVNKRLVRCLLAAGVDALGLSGVDRGLVRAVKMPHPTQDMGFTGAVESVRGEVLTNLLGTGITPVIAPVCLGEGHNFNVNADHVAGALARAISAARVVFLTNVPGVMVNGVVQSTLTPPQVEALIADGTIFGGMIPKVKTALTALTHGVAAAVITDLDGLGTGGGTTFTAQ